MAAQAAAALLQKYPDLAGIACVEAAGGSGAATAVREAKKVGQVKIVAMDRGNEVLDGIKEGVISASVAQQTALMPYYAVQIMYNLNNSKVAITSDNKAAGVLGIPAVVDTGAIVIDSAQLQVLQAVGAGTSPPRAEEPLRPSVRTGVPGGSPHVGIRARGPRHREDLPGRPRAGRREPAGAPRARRTRWWARTAPARAR